MADDTPRLGLGRFEQGDSNWDHTDTVEALDERAIERGPVSERPAEGDYDDELYFAIDQRRLYRWDADATDWVVDGGVGTEDAPLPEQHVESFRTDEASVGATPSNRPVVSNADRTIYCDPTNGDDGNDGSQGAPLATIGEALERVPIYLRHEWKIDLATAPTLPVTYDEDVNVNSVVSTRSIQDTEGPMNQLEIIGDEADPSNVEVGSIVMSGTVGANSPRFNGMTLLRDNPYDDETAALGVYGCNSVFFYNIEFDVNVTTGINARDSVVRVRDIDLSGTDTGINAYAAAAVVGQSMTAGAANQDYFSRNGSTISILDERMPDNAGQNGGLLIGDNYAELSNLNVQFGFDVGGSHHWAVTEAQLDRVLTDEAGDGDVIYLGNEEYTTDRTFNVDLTFIGTGPRAGGGHGTRVEADWTFNGRGSKLKEISSEAGTFTFNSNDSGAFECDFFSGVDVVFDSDNGRVIGCRSGTVTFNDGFSGGLVDGCVLTTVTDNDGENTVGDIG